MSIPLPPAPPPSVSNSSSKDPFDVLHLGVGADALGVSLDDLESEDVTLAAFVIDMSSSMLPVASAVIDAYNAEIHALRGARTATHILVSTMTFATTPALLHGYTKLDAVPALDHASYQPSGSTALHDAVATALERLGSYRRMLFDNGVRARSLVTVLSDGDDNASRHPAGFVKNLADRLLREEATTLAYAAFGEGLARAQLVDVAARIGFPTLITASQSPAEIRRVLGQVSASLVRAPGATGATWP